VLSSSIVIIVVVAAIVVLLYNLPHLTVSALLLSALLGGRGGAVIAILVVRNVKEIDGSTLGLHHVGEALLLLLHLAVAEGVELPVGFSLPFGRVRGPIG
jgi:hypothetical protein